MQDELHPPDEFNYLKPGDYLPEFTWSDESGNIFSSESLYGKITLIIFFTTGCQHCRINFAFLEEEFSLKSNFRLNLMAIGRECDYGQLESFKGKYSLTTPFLADPDRKIYSKFAEKIVPRIYLFDTKGILMQSIRGYKPEELREMVNSIPF